MAGGELDWITIRSAYRNKEIGAIGFYQDKAVVIVAFYADNDANQDGKVSKAEYIISMLSPIGLKGKAVTEVAMAARGDLDVYMKDPTFKDEAVKHFLDFATSAVFDGLYAVYFSRSVKQFSSLAAAGMTDNLVKQYVIRKGMEKTVKALYDSAVKNQTAFTR